jgi:predicted nucleotidyltransferase
MEIKKYSSFDEIEIELKILKLEKEISFQKLIWNIQKIKENLSPQNIIGEIVASYKSILSKTYEAILSAIIPILINWFSKRKRGD